MTTWTSAADAATSYTSATSAADGYSTTTGSTLTYSSTFSGEEDGYAAPGYMLLGYILGSTDIWAVVDEVTTVWTDV